MWDTITVAALVTVSSLFLVPRFGYQSTAAIMMVTDLVLFLSLLLLAIKPGRFTSKLPKMLKIAGSATLMGAILFLIQDWHIVPAIMLGAGVYFLSLFFLRTFGDQESEIISRIKRELLNA
jgi:hypothetical protein